MDALVTIGEFSRLTHLSVKTLRYYHDVGLLEPADVDTRSGYRMYATAQVPTAQLIRGFRDLDMPIEEVRVVLDAPDVAARDRAILGHLERMERELGRTQATVASLRCAARAVTQSAALGGVPLDRVDARARRSGKAWAGTTPNLGSTPHFRHRRRAVGARHRARRPGRRAVRRRVLRGANRRRRRVRADRERRRGCPRSWPDGCSDSTCPRPTCAIAMHSGPFSELDRTYGALGSYVAEHARVVEGPIREHYLVTADDTDDPAEYRTEVCWPVARRG